MPKKAESKSRAANERETETKMEAAGRMEGASTKKAVGKKNLASTKKTDDKEAANKKEAKPKTAPKTKAMTKPKQPVAKSASLLDSKSAYEQLLDHLAAMPDGPEKVEFAGIVEDIGKCHAADKARRPSPPTEPIPSDINKRRIQYLQTRLKEHPSMNPKERLNIRAVISAYEQGVLDLYKRQPGEQAVFWGGRLRKNWSILGLAFLNEPVSWQKEEPDGQMWVEEGVLGDHSQKVVNHFSLVRGVEFKTYSYFRLEIASWIPGNPPLYFWILNDSGSTVASIYKDDLHDLNIIETAYALAHPYPHWRGTMTIREASTTKEEEIIGLTCRVINHETQEPVTAWNMLNFIAHLDSDSTDKGNDRLSHPGMLHSLFLGMGPRQFTPVLSKTKTGMVEGVAGRL
ncbi:hypothetical protein BJ508DRAFT_330226 [Ascobolus immersus RN42]|uniref:Uncharacterized protein n=1 Tax=Ascobolus immersus RN42 TaxID=1160509 RepID=A0A3N4HU75_ASCIM|nr:hypothetical protein BJ508DRAFT_330226 [Ascobolus immersus RN42]